jgi:hypothetical protein
MASSIEINHSNFPAEIEQMKEFVEMTDSNDNLRVFSYKHCNNTTDEKVKKCRGLVFKGEQQLFRSLGFTPEYTENDRDFLSNINFDKVTFFKAEEGTLIRVFHEEDENKWYVSTHRKLNAFNSRWGGSQDSFGDIFVKSLKQTFGQDYDLETFLGTLNKKNVYLFLIRNTEQNRIVSRAPEEGFTVYHVCTLVDGDIYDTTLDVGVKRPENLSFTNIEDLMLYVNSVDPFKGQGVIGFYEDGSQFKVLNGQYQLFSHVRGNESSVMFRYLQVRSNPTYVKLMYELYPEKVTQFANYENAIFQIAKNIHFAYMERFVNKKHVVVSKEEYKIVSECHGWHISDRQNNKVSLNVVLSTLSQPRFVSLLNFLVKTHINRVI